MMLKKLLMPFLNKKLTEKDTVSFIAEKIGRQIYTGPFSGLKIPESLVPKMKLAEILGLYEYALHPKISSLINKNINNIMIIGGHKGYYPAGLSLLLAPENMFVFEMDKSFVSDIESWIEINHLKPYEIYGEATEEILKNYDKSIDFLLIDCEGAEDFLLNPKIFPWQKKSEILVEIHQFYNNKILGNLIERFSETHNLEIIYDNIAENERIENILSGLEISGSYRGQPLHRWIFDDKSEKIITSGVFLYMSKKIDNDS